MNITIIDNLYLKFSDIKEQQRIADYLSSLDNLIKYQEDKAEVLKQHKQGLMQQLFPVVESE